METRERLDGRRSDASPPAHAEQVYVISTTEEGTRAALAEARRVSRRLNLAPIVLLVPRLGVSAALVDGPAKDATVTATYRQMAAETGVDITVRQCVCDSYREAFQWMLQRGAVVVVGGRRRWWWPTREERMRDQLKRAGYITVFAEVS